MKMNLINQRLKKEIYQVLPWWNLLTVQEILEKINIPIEKQHCAALLHSLEHQGLIKRYVDNKTHIAYYSRKHLFRKEVD